MKLPHHELTLVPREKIVEYLLSTTHSDGKSKAAFFISFGFTVDGWEMLANALRLHASACEVVRIEATPFGTRYIVEGEMNAPDGRHPSVRVVWFIEKSEEIPRLVTAYPL